MVGIDFISPWTQDQTLPLQSAEIAQFSSNPMQSHASAVKMTIRYLLATSEKGIIFRPTTDFKVDCYVDTVFA